jgi:hypothetical protein
MMNLYEEMNVLISSIENTVGLLSRAQRIWSSVKALLPSLGLQKPTVSEPYENRFLELVVDIRDSRGDKAVLSRRQGIRFLSAEHGLIRDLVWGDGNTLARYCVRGARRLSVQPEGSKSTVLLGLDRPTRQGESKTVHVRRLMEGSFCGDSEYFETLVERPTDRLSMKVLFPKARPPTDGYLVSTPPERLERRVPVRYSSDQRPFLAWRIDQPEKYRTYSLRWSW